ncbi:bifunctional DNA-formamidopyrimidine glycosylase/DNA-(apurinic or apyrimidinic site) lyase [Candidatus Falkowbacteria bacterium]|nr:bifunctional DNA-formamidopyrimidine glycosylase/DNA-(apurinic or apyrimidinic site) lyase [Candidatus Falkowbacteria bacterium]
MPELPEVETIKRGLEKNIVGKTISDFDCNWRKIINKPLAAYKKILKDLKIESVNRRAKMIILNLSKSWNLLIHLKMTGQLVYGSKTKCLVGGHPIVEGYDCLPNKFTHATITFTDKSHLYFNDIRKFGWMHLLTDSELEKEIAEMKLGIEPFDKNLTLDYFKSLFKKRPNLKIKQFLMDQSLIAGLGNIYSDEVDFYAHVRPMRTVKSLSEKEINLIYKGIKKILIASIKAQGTTFSNYRNAEGEAGAYSKQLRVYGKWGEDCLCGGKILRAKIGGRSASYCPKCQK